MKYEEWLQSTCQDAMKKLLRTVDKIVDEADDKMTGTEIDHIKDCFNAISMIHYLVDGHCHCNHSSSNGSTNSPNSSESIYDNITRNLALRTS